ncbi:DUF4181 domain-containing protein [Aquibacillus kalidii]|uniref:DUF4181 domain-containing protein n=1 Tax=Aquibacillus kalidii TaxID=2762597 RepID=UPI0016480D82|nr:DUF4181 domain-containing protein [Aquibacillus kalidii]
MFSDETVFWYKVILILGLYFIFSLFLNKKVREWLRVEKKSIFLFNYVNQLHKKVDRIIRIIFIICFILFAKIIIIEGHPFIYIITFLTVSELTKAFMEWKFATNKNDYKYTIYELSSWLLFLIVLFAANYYRLI